MRNIFAIFFPRKIPVNEKILAIVKNSQSMAKFPISPINPNIDWIAMIKRELPTALFISRPLTKTKVGTIRKPPPAPTKPATAPTNKP